MIPSCRASAEDLLSSPNLTKLLLRIGVRLRLLSEPRVGLFDRACGRGSPVPLVSMTFLAQVFLAFLADVFSNFVRNIAFEVQAFFPGINPRERENI